jgi:hypothetical protein
MAKRPARHATDGIRYRPTLPVPAPIGGAGTIRGRLTRILALPMVVVLVLLGILIAGELGDFRTARDTTASVRLALAVQNAAEQLQAERGLTSGLLGGYIDFKGELPAVRTAVDTQVTALTRLAAGDGTGKAAVRAALEPRNGLGTIRALIDDGRLNPAEAFDYFTTWIASLNATDLGLDNSTDRALRRHVAALDALGTYKEYVAQERAFLTGVFAAGRFRPGEYAQFATVYGATRIASARLAATVTPAQAALTTAVEATGAYSEAKAFEQRALNTPTAPLQVDPQAWWSSFTTVLDGIAGQGRSIGADIQHRAEVLETGATRRLVLLGGLGILTMIGALVLLIFAARAISSPLALLAAEAGAVASRRLPDAVAAVQARTGEDMPEPPLPVRVSPRASSELHLVAEALDRVQATAYALATEQAVLRRNTTESLANLGRRNQSLLRRQLGFITRLEREESDPAGLANLFELDHLATRMRRNAESLLVLVGQSSPRVWGSAMPIADVIRAAISEVEEYRRVDLRRIDAGFVAGGFVAGLAHLVAELVENGLTFSQPDVDVEVQGRHFGDHYLIAVVDAGVGMGAEDLARANARLAGTENFLMAPAKFLGHYVVGQLARQLGVRVELTPSPVTGVTARVTVPAALLGEAPAIEASPVAASPVAADAVADIVEDEPQSRVIRAVEYLPAQTSGVAVAERTRNGLAKRPPRAARTGAKAKLVVTEPSATLDDSPEQVRDRMMALRKGFQRNEQEKANDER